MVMKELSIKEKAKAYDKAIERARVWKEKSGMPADRQGILDDIFPELKDSEDEQHCKWILEYLYDGLLKSDEQFKDQFKCAIAWFEKQGKNNMGISEATKQELEDNLNKALEKETPESWNEFLDEQGEHKPWSEEDEDILNTIINHFKVDIGCTDEDDMVRWLKFLKERYTWKPSEEQMKALEYYIEKDFIYKEGVFGKRIVELYAQLKKLREE